MELVNWSVHHDPWNTPSITHLFEVTWIPNHELTPWPIEVSKWHQAIERPIILSEKPNLPPSGSLHRQWEVIPSLKLLKIPSLKHEIHRNSSTLTLSRWCCPAYRLPSWLRMRPSYRFDIDSISYTGWYPSKRKYTQPNEISWDIMMYHEHVQHIIPYHPIFSYFFCFRLALRLSFLRRQSFTRWTELSWAAPWRPDVLLLGGVIGGSDGYPMGHQWVINGWTMGEQWVNNGYPMDKINAEEWIVIVCYSSPLIN